jgi:hypothetical protein
LNRATRARAVRRRPRVAIAAITRRAEGRVVGPAIRASSRAHLFR